MQQVQLFFNIAMPPQLQRPVRPLLVAPVENIATGADSNHFELI